MAAQVTSAAALWSPARFRCSCRLLALRKPMGTRGSGIGMRALQTIVAGEKLRGKQSQVKLAENFSSKPGGTAKNGRRSLMVVRMAMREESSLREVYQGIYGPWSVEDVDVREVPTYFLCMNFLQFVLCGCKVNDLLLYPGNLNFRKLSQDHHAKVIALSNLLPFYSRFIKCPEFYNSSSSTGLMPTSIPELKSRRVELLPLF